MLSLDSAAGVVELVDAHDSKSCSARSVGSSPTTGTTTKKAVLEIQNGFFYAIYLHFVSEINFPRQDKSVPSFTPRRLHFPCLGVKMGVKKITGVTIWVTLNRVPMAHLKKVRNIYYIRWPFNFMVDCSKQDRCTEY